MNGKTEKSTEGQSRDAGKCSYGRKEQGAGEVRKVWIGKIMGKSWSDHKMAVGRLVERRNGQRRTFEEFFNHAARRLPTSTTKNFDSQEAFM